MLKAGDLWGVVLSARAVKELRTLQRDQQALEIVHKKLRELSMGNFSDENCRPIEGTLQFIPLFRAKVSLDLRIIYQIDVLPDLSGTYDHQVIKIFQIKPRARVDYQLWAKISIRLQRSNSDYRGRCSYRLGPDNGNDMRKYPAMFPHEDYGPGISNEESGFLRDGLTDEEREEIQEVIMDRFAPYSKSLYNSIIADFGIAFPIILDEHERAIVSHKGTSIVIGRSGTGKTTALIYKIHAVDHAMKRERRPSRQLFVTRSRVLAQRVEATYHGLTEFTNIASKSEKELKEMAKQSREDPDRALVEFDTEVDLRNDLPPRYSELTQSHFPLFISFDKLCSLLEGDIDQNVPGQISSEGLIGYDDFLHRYWPSFRSSTKGLEPNLVWSEIIGVIKGSLAAFNSKGGHLSREDYVNELSQRQLSLSVPVRAKVYSVFEFYAKQKASLHEIDDADRTHTILRNLPQILRRANIDYLYVDEVQDNLMIDIYLLRKLAKNSASIYWSGDSAQTIVAGSLIRVDDLKTFAYQDQVAAALKSVSVPRFTTFDLHVNFRSLSGIVRFARFLVQSIHAHFPQTIDLMKPERAKQYGDPPLLFTGIRNEAGYFEQFLLGSSAKSRVAFGAQQAILVRDAATAEELDARLQGLCNVLPITDSKGLEFDDVLIYNFFSQSPAPEAAWQYLSETTRSKQPPPILCSELKLLYVAVTRARHRCWIWDSGTLIRQPMGIWISHGLVNTEPASNMVGQFTASSSKAEWSAKGREYFAHRLYKLAAGCFRQAEEPNQAKLASAYNLMTRAKLRRLRGDTPASHEELTAAATELLSCAELSDISDPKNIFFHAATCFKSAQQIVPAATAFVQAGQATEGFNLLFDADDYKTAATLLADNRKKIETNVFEALRERVREHLFEHQEYGQLELVFDSVDEKIKYAQQPDYGTQLKYILNNHQRFHELAEVHLLEKNIRDAVAFFVKAYQTSQTRASIVRAVELAISYTESVLLVEGTYRKNDQELAKFLIEQVQPFASRVERDSYLKVDLFYGYLCSGYVSLERVLVWDQTNVTHQCMRTLAGYLAIKSNSWLREDSTEILLEYLDLLGSYKVAILGIVMEEYPCTLPFARKLLGFAPVTLPSSSRHYRILPSSLIRHRTLKAVCTGDEVDAIVHRELPKRLNGLIESWHSTALALNQIQPRRFSNIPLVRHSFPSQTVAALQDSCTEKLYIITKVLGALYGADTNTPKNERDDNVLSNGPWLGRIFEIIYLANGGVESLRPWPVEPGLDVTPAYLNHWLMRDWARSFDSGYITDMLLRCFIQSGLNGTLFEQLDAPAFPISTILTQEQKVDVAQPLHEFFFTQNFDRIHKAVAAIQYLLDNDIRPDVAVMIHFIESLVRDIIVYTNSTGVPQFDGLLLPLSWVRALAHKYKDIFTGCSVNCLGKICFVIKQISDELRFGAPGRWLYMGKQIMPTMVDLLNLRLCWCISLAIGHMDEPSGDLPLALEALRQISSDEMPPKSLFRNSTAVGPYHAFMEVQDHQAVFAALRQTLRHESLTLVLKDSLRHPSVKLMTGVTTIVYADTTELLGKLDQVSPLPSPRSSNGRSSLGIK